MKQTHKPTPLIWAATLSAVIALPASLKAGELTLKPGKFSQTIELNAVALPKTVKPMSISPKAWKNFKIMHLVEHGSQVKKGEVLVDFDTKDLDKKIADLEKARVKQLLSLKAAEQGLDELKRQTPIKLANAKLKHEQFVEDYNHYKSQLRAMNIDDAKWSVIAAERSLSYAKEELDQLLKMYKADGLTEDTEEIIITRAKNAVERGERALDRVKKRAKHQLEVAIPRTDEGWEKAAVQDALAWESAQKNIPRALKMRQEDVDLQRKQVQEAAEYLEKLKGDRELMNFTAPVDGVVYYGEFKDGVWNSGVARKYLREGGMFPAQLVMMSVVPSGTPLVYTSFLDASKHAVFRPSQKAFLRLATNPWQSYAVNSSHPAVFPDLNNKWKVEFSPVDKAPDAIIGSKATVSVIVFDANNVLTVPAKAVTRNADGTNSVRVKMAEGEPKTVNVSIGREAGGRLEVLKGLTAGQVVITP